MYVHPIERNATLTSSSISQQHYEDPLDEDSKFDAPIITTRRGLIRVALVAAETASRFIRDEIETDPMVWMLAPRILFDGRAALEACLSRDACLRAVLLHGLAIGLDAEPADLDELASGRDGMEGDDELNGCGIEHSASIITDEVSGRGLSASQVVQPNVATQDRMGAPRAFDAITVGCRLEAQVRQRNSRGNVGKGGGMEGCSYANLPSVGALLAPTFAAIQSPAAARRPSRRVAAVRLLPVVLQTAA